MKKPDKTLSKYWKEDHSFDEEKYHQDLKKYLSSKEREE